MTKISAICKASSEKSVQNEFLLPWFSHVTLDTPQIGSIMYL